MTRFDRRTGLAAALTASALLVAACGGGTSSASPAGAASAAPSAAPASVAPSAEASSPAVASAAPSSAIAIPSFDLSQLVNQLENVDSYKIAIVVDGKTQYAGTVVTKPELARDVTVSGQHIVMVGQDVWLDTGSGLQPVPATQAQAMLGMFDPAMLVGAIAQPGAMAGATEVGSEEKNGVSAKHYRIEAGSFIGTLASMPPGAAIDIWIADDGYLTSLTTTGMTTSGDLAIDVTNVNDPANKVERPS